MKVIDMIRKRKTLYTVQPVHTGPCTNRNPVYTVMIIWSRINCTQNNTN